MPPEVADSNLCYLDADKVKTPVGDLAGLELRGRDNGELGSLKGVLIEAGARKVRFFVLEAAGWFRNRCYLLPADAPLRFEPDAHALRLESDNPSVTVCDPRDIKSVRPYSDEDVLAALLASPAA